MSAPLPAPVWDNHACPPMAIDDLPAHLPTLQRYRDAGVDVVSLNIGYGEMAWEDHLAMAKAITAWLAAHPDRFVLARSLAEIDAARGAGRLAVVFDVEGAAPLEGDLGRVAQLRQVGVRWMLLAYNRRNWAAGGVHEAAGLTPEGVRLIRQMEDAGIVVCLSHTAHAAAMQALAIARKPMILSHSNPRALCDHPRNITDDLARACAARGGAIGVNGLRLFLGTGAPVERLVLEHVLYLVKLVGPRHVGLGLDFVFDLAGLEAEKAAMASTFPGGCGYEQPTECTPPEAIPALRAGLAAAGLAGEEIAAILGGNWQRIAEECWGDMPATA
ncbi:dipeptidase [Erythrobacter sp. NE805]|uniref:dipeptidase n=1 Tax=Erythrobacter sp. NE805 TaxID=3389875 RepID=UPI00396B253E